MIPPIAKAYKLKPMMRKRKNNGKIGHVLYEQRSK